MALSADDVGFLENNHSAAMVTVGDDGLPKIARVAVVLIDDRLWSSGTEDRVRTRRLRRNPSCTLYVHGEGWSWVALETTVTILDGPEAPAQNLRLFRSMQDRPSGPLNWFGAELEEEDFLSKMLDERRLIYEFETQRSYGMR